MNNGSKILAVLLILSISGNIYLFSLIQPAQKTAYFENSLNSTPTNLQGFAGLQAPAVMQSIEYTRDYPFVRQQVVEKGNMINISAEIRSGEGRVLVQTKPLMGTVFQDAANTAVYVAENKTGMKLSNSDVIFSIESQKEIPSVDGPSAGALMTLLVTSALEKKELKNDVTLTGTIDQYGHVGAIGGVVEKAKAAKESGKNLLLLPSENSKLVQYVEKTRTRAGLTITRQVPKTVDARQYIESNVGIKVEYVDNIDDILKYVM
jgi:predicted S18 family serine protease